MNYLKPGSWEYKKNSALCGEAAFQYVVYAIRLAMEGKVDAVITAPISKESKTIFRAMGVKARNANPRLFNPQHSASLTGQSYDFQNPFLSDHPACLNQCAGIYDIVVAMYHDQGHIPLKLDSFQWNEAEGKYSSVKGINTTIGLPIIRVSVDHGTAFGKAGTFQITERGYLNSRIIWCIKRNNVF